MKNLCFMNEFPSRGGKIQISIVIQLSSNDLDLFFLTQKHPDLSSLQAMASGEDSNSSDTAASDHGDDIEGMNGNVEHTRPSFPFLGLQGIPGLIPGPSGMHGDNFGECALPVCFYFSLQLSLV